MKITTEASASGADLLNLQVHDNTDLGALYRDGDRWRFVPPSTQLAGEDAIVIPGGSGLTIEISAPEGGGPALVRVARR